MTTKEVLEMLMKKTLVRGKPITPNALAKKCRIGQSTMWRILDGQVTDVRTHNLEKLAKFFGVSVEEVRGTVPPRKTTKMEVPAETMALDAPAVTELPEHPAMYVVRHLIYVTMEEMEKQQAAQQQQTGEPQEQMQEQQMQPQ